MDTTTRLQREILRWAQTTIDSISEQELSDDWWGAYDEDWDVNIWWDLYTYRVTAYPMVEGMLVTKEFLPCGPLMPAWKMKDDNCSICGDPMGRSKGENSQPVRLPSGDEFAHFICATEEEL